uniref:A disintegrin and metalloproteinase with thrombospondin motifs 7 isoform X1 n=1 Tax=Pogona vitticeps TaxID=103695 RepID=A0A6J0V7N1_9SAUR
MALLSLVLVAAFLARGGCADIRGAGSIHVKDSTSDIVYPVKIDERGFFISYNLSYRFLYRRDVLSQNRPLAFYKLYYGDQQLRFNLSLNSQLLAPGFVSEKRYGGIAHAKIQAHNQNSCHLIGSVQNQEQESGLAAISTCDGLKGVFRLADEDFFIEPLVSNETIVNTAHPHRIYRRHIPEYETEELISVVSRKQPDFFRMCGVQESPAESEKQREKWEETWQRKRRIKQRSVSKEKWVETLVVADTKMVEYHGSNNIEKYVLTVMNMVAGLFHDASIGNPIHISIVRLIFLENEEEDLKITHHADNTLRSFCKWQKAINVKGDTHPLHHDVAILLTRKDLCTAVNHPCETLGLSHVSGMCQPHRSCNINEDTGLPLAFTVAHELGHSFGIQHDGSGNDCEPVGKRPFIMSPQLLYDTSPLTWSHCSREYITRFLDRGWGLCLDDPPAPDVIDFFPSIPPGVLYDVSHQCRLQYGAHSTYCDDMDSVCHTLWCSVGNTCHSKLDAAVDGTRCDENKWCFNGECVHMEYHPESIDGGWAAWSSWSSCSRSCGAGVQSAERQCSNPMPKYGGKYCLGERKCFRVCNIHSCPANKPSFRHIQCSRFDARPYKGKFYTWIPVLNRSNPCELHCRPKNEYFSEKLRDAVIDGTPCHEGNSSRDMCINGICKNVGCDYEIDSYAMEDRCGVCHGDGSTCQTVKKTFEETEGVGYVDVGLIPPGAREIRIEEVAEAENFLALRSEDPEKYFLNGGWTIQWNGNYKVAGTTFTYERTGNWENLTSPGPTEEPVWIQLLFQEKNPGIRYQYTIQRKPDNENEIIPAEFFWQYASWTKCTVTCGTGIQRQIAHCIEKVIGVVEERYCDVLNRPEDKQRTCSMEPCPARWWTGEWQVCSASCGDNGLMKRTVLCIQSVGLDEQQALQPSKCQNLSKPNATAPCNREVLCPAQWITGNWSECSVTCGSGTRQRPVYCPRKTCNPLQRPVSEIACSLTPCWSRIESSEWSGSGSSSKELFNEISFIPNHHFPKFSPSMPKSEDLNVIIEQSFLPTDNEKGNVFVDDFYYDYNFINFHEDLSYDPMDENDSGRKDLKPVWLKTVNSTKKDSKDMHPSFLPTRKQESTMTNEYLHYPVIGQSDDKELVIIQDNTTVSLHGSVGSVSTFSVTTPPVIKEKGTQASNLTIKHFLTSSNHVSIGKTQENLSTNKVSKENVAALLFSTNVPYSADLTSVMSSGKDSSSQENESHAPDSRQQSNARMLNRKSSKVFGGGDIKSGVLRNMAEKSNVEQNNIVNTFVNSEDNAGTLQRIKDVQINTVTAGRPFYHSTHQPSHSTDITPNIRSSYRLRNDKSHNIADVESHQRSPTDVSVEKYSLPPTADPPQEVSPHSSAHELVTIYREILASHNSDSKGLPFPAEPTSVVHSPVFSNSSLSMPATPTLKEYSAMKIDLDTEHNSTIGGQDSFRDRNESSSNRVHWIFANGNGDVRPSSIPSKHHEVKNKMLPSLVPSAILASVFNTSWEVGNWSQCSTTCGLGAIWRSVRCRSGKEEDCSHTTKPVPAQRCYPRPCATWRIGNWSKCSRTCGDGVKFRDIHCVDSRDQRHLRPFHCQGVLYKPPIQMTCKNKPCLGWYTSSWRECSELCGGGEQERLVTCPEFGRCDEALQPKNTRSCNIHPCTKWTVGSWGQCSATCGGGIQRRQVKCINTKTGEAEDGTSLCDHEQQPGTVQKCNLQDCNVRESSFVCQRNQLSFNFCQTLLLLGRCHLPTVSIQCCKTCHHHSHWDRGNERASRK